MLLLMLACGDKTIGDKTIETASPLDSAEPVIDCTDAPGVTWESWGEGFFMTWCQPCHSATTLERNGAPEGVDFDTEANIVFWAESIRRTVLEQGSMPIGGGLSKDDAVLLEALLDCGL